MSNLIEADRLFFERAGLDRSRIERTVADSLKGADDGELYLEYAQSEALSYDDGRLKSASFDTTQGFGLRAVSGRRSMPAMAASSTWRPPGPTGSSTSLTIRSRWCLSRAR
jgi:TldD protein